MDKAAMGQGNLAFNYVGSWDICSTCGKYRNEHNKDSDHTFIEAKKYPVTDSSDICAMCGFNYDKHAANPRDFGHEFIKSEGLHPFVNVPGRPNCGFCNRPVFDITHTESTTKPTYRKPIHARFDLLPPIALRRVAEVYEEGAQVYGESRYISQPMAHSNVVNHLINHLNLAQCGDDSEDHWAKVAWAALTMIVYKELGLGEDDLSAYGVVPKNGQK